MSCNILKLIIDARIKDGFRISGVSIKKKLRPTNEKRFEISMEFIWLPQVKIHYTVKSSIIVDKGFQLSSKSLKISISINAHFNFALYFINFHDYDGHDRLNSLYLFLREIYDSDLNIQMLADIQTKDWIKIKGIC